MLLPSYSYWPGGKANKKDVLESREDERHGYMGSLRHAWLRGDWGVTKCSPIMLMPKLDGTIHFCVNFWGVNAISHLDVYPMPYTDELLEQLGKAKYLTTLDLTKDLWQIPLTSVSKEKTAFATHLGLFHFTMMLFVPHEAPATFQRFMDYLLWGHWQYASAYIDDVVIFSTD